MQIKNIYSSWILSLSALIFTFFSCKGGNNQAQEITTPQNNDSIQLIIGDAYDRSFSWSEEFTYPSNHVYFKVGDYPQVELPFDLIGYASTKVFPEMKEDFLKQYPKKKAGKIVFSFYTEYADAGDIYFGTQKDKMLRIYAQEITQEDDATPYYRCIAVYDISAQPKLTALLDQNHYTPQQLEQDFFQPITYTEKEIEEYLKNQLSIPLYTEDAPDLVGLKTNRYEEFYGDAIDYIYDPEGVWTEEDFNQKWGNIYDLSRWSEDDATDYVCYGDIAFEKITPKILKIKKDNYFCEVEAEVDFTTHEGWTGSCLKYIRLVQINGLLYMDAIFDPSQPYEGDKPDDTPPLNEEILGDYPN